MNSEEFDTKRILPDSPRRAIEELLRRGLALPTSFKCAGIPLRAMPALPVGQIATLIELFLNDRDCIIGRLIVINPELNRNGIQTNMTTRGVVFVFYETIDAIKFEQVLGR